MLLRLSCLALIILLGTQICSPVAAASTLAQQLSGRLLLAVQDAGAGWYVNPLTWQRVELGSPANALATFQALALGINNLDLALIPVSGQTSTSNLALRQRLAGRLLLAVEDHGKTWYVNPLTLTRSYFATSTDVFNLLTQN